jgi:Flp pilus assembly protein TadB
MPPRPAGRSVQYMSTATKDHPSGSLRVSDADRDRAIAELSEHYQAGRLTTEELEDRTGRALKARTAADLAGLFTDLPRKRQVPATPAASAPVSRGTSWPARVPMVPFAVLAVMVALVLLGALPHIAWVLVLAFVVVRLLAGGRRCRRWDGRAPS